MTHLDTQIEALQKELEAQTKASMINTDFTQVFVGSTPSGGQKFESRYTGFRARNLELIAQYSRDLADLQEKQKIEHIEMEKTKMDIETKNIISPTIQTAQKTQSSLFKYAALAIGGYFLLG